MFAKSRHEDASHAEEEDGFHDGIKMGDGVGGPGEGETAAGADEVCAGDEAGVFLAVG